MSLWKPLGFLCFFLEIYFIFIPVLMAEQAPPEQLIGIIESFQRNPKGPYERIAWFCKDGTIQPPKSFACKGRGGGIQHGVLSSSAHKLAESGIHVGTVLAALNPKDWIAHDFYRAKAYLIENFLEKNMDGWVLKSAKDYRGFRQAEDEEQASKKILEEIVKSESWIHAHRLLAVRLIRALPYGGDEKLADQIRINSRQLAEDDPKFGSLRSKIHSMLEPGDADRVLAYAKKTDKTKAALAQKLAQEIRLYFDPAQLKERLQKVKKDLHSDSLKSSIDAFISTSPKEIFIYVEKVSHLLAQANERLHSLKSSQEKERLATLHIMAIIDEILPGLASLLKTEKMTRVESLKVLLDLFAGAGYLGIFSKSESKSIGKTLKEIQTGKIKDYLEGYQRLSRTVDWAYSRILIELDLALKNYRSVESEAQGVIDDILRGGILLPTIMLLDRIQEDIEKSRGTKHKLFGFKGSGIRAENPGLAIGPLKILKKGESSHSFKRHQIVLLEEFPPELPPVAGIITIGDVGSLSHISLLIRNLAIPHISISQSLAKELYAMESKELVLGVSPAGLVSLGTLDLYSHEDRELLGRSHKKDKPFLKIDESRLNLKDDRIYLFDELSEKDAGVKVGPKAAELARLKKMFPEQVSQGVVLPFGIFVKHVSRQLDNKKPSPLERLQKVYAQVKDLDVASAESKVIQELAHFREAIETLPFPAGFEEKIEAALKKLGTPYKFGVFVRSDTNVEDLKEFTGAGLNLTIPNQVKKASILNAIRKVWASPFTERSYAWRQRILMNPAQVYPSVILHKTVPADLSGVMVTANLQDGSTLWTTVSVSQGVAAVVDSGFPETLLISKKTDQIKYLASSQAAGKKTVPSPPQEGLMTLRAEKKGQLLGGREIHELKKITNVIEKKVKSDLPWDVEFGFVGKKLYLMQLRPLKISRSASFNPYLKKLDEAIKSLRGPIDLKERLP
jgi:hypothetical protein